jgi:uncharacterized protein YbbC (DUF1343 family)
MEAAAEANIEVMVLDRANPHDHYVDGPVMKQQYTSFVGLHPVPVVYGMTIGEYARMINGEKWLKGEESCSLTVIPCKNYRRKEQIALEVPPSPNLPNQNALLWYPSLCFFEGTVISVGRGTSLPFQHFGHPAMEDSFTYYFIPQSTRGATAPKYEGEKCYGLLLPPWNDSIPQQLNLEPLLAAYRAYPDTASFFNNFFNLLAGNGSLQTKIRAGKSENEIRTGWTKDLEEFERIRKKYLLYD